MTNTARTTTESITIRPAYADDYAALSRLAALDGAEQLPTRPVLLAEVDGVLRAALSLKDGVAVADPFYPTLHVVHLLRAHAATDGRGTQRRRRRRRAWRLIYA